MLCELRLICVQIYLACKKAVKCAEMCPMLQFSIEVRPKCGMCGLLPGGMRDSEFRHEIFEALVAALPETESNFSSQVGIYIQGVTGLLDDSTASKCNSMKPLASILLLRSQQ